MRVLVDTSVWSRALRRRQAHAQPRAEMLADLISSGEQVFLTGIVLQEILQGVKEQAQFSELERRLEPFPLLEPSRTTHKQAAILFSKCRAKGTPVATVDCLIAAIALEKECRLLSDDLDFEKLAAVSALKLL